MQSAKNFQKEWNQVWSGKGFGFKFISLGRNVYSSFFKRLLMPYLTKSSEMLELGCGTATVGILVHSHIKRYTGLDISNVALEETQKQVLKSNINNMDFIKGDCRNVAWINQFDLVWSQGLIEHFDDPEHVIREHFKATKPGGATVIGVPCKCSYFSIWYALTRLKFLRHFWPWTDQVFFPVKSLEALGKNVSPTARAFMLQPFILGIVILEITKPIMSSDGYASNEESL